MGLLADHCLTKGATARKKLQSTLRFARSACSAPDLRSQPAAQCGSHSQFTLKTANSDSQVSKCSAAPQRASSSPAGPSRATGQQALQILPPQQCPSISPFKKAADASRADRAAKYEQGNSAQDNSGSQSPDQAASPDRKRSRLSWSSHDSEQSASEGVRGIASPSLDAEAASGQTKPPKTSPRRKKPQSRASTAGSQERSSGGLTEHVRQSQGQPGSTCEPSQAHRQPGEDALHMSEEAQHNSSSSRETAAARHSFQTFAVGRRFHPTVKVEQGQGALLQHQPCNAKDPNALMVLTCPAPGQESGQVLGYLPATVAASLVSIVKEGLASISITVLERPKTPKASLPITVEVGPLSASSGLLSVFYACMLPSCMSSHVD